MARSNRPPRPKFVVRSEGAGLAAIRHPDIASNFERALRWTPKSGKAVLVPCAGTKPFYEAPSHRSGYLDALEGKDADLWVVSEPLGVVPYDWSDRYPNAHYDYPPRYLTGEAWDELVQRVARWLRRVAPKYDRVFAALPGHHARLLGESLAVHDPGNVTDVTHDACLRSGACPPGHGRATSGRYRSFLRRRVNPDEGRLVSRIVIRLPDPL